MSDEIASESSASIPVIGDAIPTIADTAYRLAWLQDKLGPQLKRILDFSAAVILLIIVLPLGCLIIVLITLSGQVPFCSRVQVGQGGREFGWLKFRTMQGDAGVALVQEGQDANAKRRRKTNSELQSDPPFTRVGQILHATSLDELPQLINILSGDMGFVGPRPVTSDELARFYSPSEADAYFLVRPGLTGW